MKSMNRFPRPPRAVLLALMALASVPLPVLAENVDPASDGSRYAWSENLGWINAEPQGDGGPGMQVDDFEVTGWLWSENAGWISLSCKSSESCQALEYGVRNDGSGNLSGYAWGENIGWVSFDHSQGHVVVDIENGMLFGYAWAENVGWIHMSDDSSPEPYGIRSGWSCSPPPPPPAVAPDIRLSKDGEATIIEWNPADGASAYDVVYGSLQILRSPPHAYDLATLGCLGENRTLLEVRFDGVPTLDDPYWFLLRPVNCGGTGSYDSDGPGLIGPRDPGIELSPEPCTSP